MRAKKQPRSYILDDLGNLLKASCNCCGQMLEPEMFHRHRNNKHGIATKCKECISEYKKANPEQQKKHQKTCRDSKRHSPCVYHIDFGNGFCYIGQTNNCWSRKKDHKNRSKVLKTKSPRAIQLYLEDVESWKNAVNEMKVVKEFKCEHDFEILEFEYSLQLEALKSGKKLLGKQYEDSSFRLWLKMKEGKEEALRLIEISRSVNCGVEK